MLARSLSENRKSTRQLLHALFYLRDAGPLHPCSRAENDYN